MSGRCSVDVVRVLLGAWGDAARGEVFGECRGYSPRAHHEPAGPGRSSMSDDDVEAVARALVVLRAYNVEQHAVLVNYYRGREPLANIAAHLGCGVRRVKELKGLAENFIAGQVL